MSQQYIFMIYLEAGGCCSSFHYILLDPVQLLVPFLSVLQVLIHA